MSVEPLQWNADLLRRYDQTGPRYTSYPTALQFHDGIDADAYRAALQESAREKRPLSLYVHLPFCASICYYCACNKVVTKDRGRARAYLERLYHEIRLVSQRLNAQQVVEQLHFGGGTPTFLSHAELRELMGYLAEHFQLLDDDMGDYGIEIDPREADWSTMGLLRELGFNRISLGVQDLDPEVQRAVNRLQSLEQTRAIVEAGRTLAFRSISIDLIYGLPKQNSHSFAKTVEQVIALQPDRLSLFNYAHLPERFMPQRRIQSSDLPSASEKLSMLQNSIEQLCAAGYRYIGMDHFALADDDLAIAQEDGRLHRNFQGYTSHGHCDLIGLGVSAISQVGTLYSQNSSDLSDYMTRLDQHQLATKRGVRCSHEDLLRRHIIMQLMCQFELNIADLEQRFALNFYQHFALLWPQLQQLASDGLIDITATSLRVLPAGRLLVRAVCMLFDDYLTQANQRRFSRVI
jgi:oxygen-independent coproporphyrinogen-3 oxidase